MDFSPLLTAVATGSPCGPDLYDDDAWFTKMNLLEAKVAGEKKTGYEDGKPIEVWTPPKWPEVKSSAYELCHESRTLRLGVILTECAFELEGITGFRDGLRMLTAWLEEWWEHIHPMPPEEAGPSRCPILNALNQERFVFRLRKIPVARSHGQSYSIQDIVQNEGSGGDANLALLAQQAVAGMDSIQRIAMVEAVKEASEDVRKIAEIIREKCGSRYNMSMGELLEALTDFRKHLQMEEILNDGDVSAREGAVPSSGNGSTSSGGGFSLNSKAGVRSGLEAMIAFYGKSEPSSPVPMILQRALRCMDMSFLQLLDEMAPTKEEAIKLLRSPSDPSEGDA
jgi:type VI secretion system protein ImpA